jgi:lysophospholipase L1-like esterase
MRVIRARLSANVAGGVAAAAVVGLVCLGASSARADTTPTGTATTTSTPSTSTSSTTAPPTVTVTATVTAPPRTVTVTAPTTVTATATVTQPAPTVTVTGAPTAPPTREVWVFGDSISVGAWIPDTAKAWPYLVAQRAVPWGVNVRDFGVGGANLHLPDGKTGPILLDILRNRFAGEGNIPDVVVLAIGTNDMLNHNLEDPGWSSTSVVASEYAAIDVENYLRSKGVKRIVWNTVYPFARHDTAGISGAAIPWYWLPPLQDRTNHFNTWLSAMWGGDIVDTNLTLLDWTAPGQGDARYFLDGFHPTTEGHGRIAASFPLSALMP